MKYRFRRHILAAALAASASGAFVTPSAVAAGGAVLPVARRLEALKVAERVVKRERVDVGAKLAELEDPFFRSTPAPVDASAAGAVEAPLVVATPRKSDEQILHEVAPRITPTGTMLVGTVPYLLIGGRRYKVGDQISVTFDELMQVIEIASIERNSYTLRLNATELRREFK